MLLLVCVAGMMAKCCSIQHENVAQEPILMPVLILNAECVWLVYFGCTLKLCVRQLDACLHAYASTYAA